MWTWFHKLGSPPHFYRIAGKLAPWFGVLAAIALIAGTFKGLVLAPADYQQGDGFRIIYVHVPSAYLSLMAYVVMATGAAIGLIWRMKLAHAVAAACAPIGASFTFLALATGSIWGRPMWGTWWEWGDARLTSELILLFLYLGYMALRASIDDTNKADRASAVLAIVGVINVPIIHYSVEWWSSLHQGATLAKFDQPSITGNMLTPLLIMIIGFTLFFAAVLLTRARAEVLERERHSRWVKRELLGDNAVGESIPAGELQR
ncbi:heme ABC transporter permease [Lentisalinibacter sediminis]|uniref:heme ABC transporter permease n=1 Tax=Lentisalinibacter sediminis TaxID=2992237 RepID=UPI003863F367